MTILCVHAPLAPLLPGNTMQLTRLALQTRSFAAVLFRRIASKTRKADSGATVDMFLSLAADHAIAIRQKLLQSLAVESDKNVRNKVSHAVAEVARQYTENSQCSCRLLVSAFTYTCVSFLQTNLGLNFLVRFSNLARHRKPISEKLHSGYS